MTFDAIIFDMDGLLINSEDIWYEADKFFEKRNILLTDEIQHALMGKSFHQSAAWLKERYLLSESVEEIIAERQRDTDGIYTHLARPLPGVQELLERLSQTDIPLAIGSGSSLRRIEEIVDRFDWRKYFEVLASSEHVEYKGKPDPDIFLYAADRLGKIPETCVVLEDSINGVTAAKLAGMSCIAVPAPQAKKEDFVAADIIVPSLQEPAVYSFLGI